MPYDDKLAGRIRAILREQRGITERKMFGGIAFLKGGNMCCGVIGTALMLRLGKDGADAALLEPHVRPMDFTGKPLGSMVYVDPPGTRSDDDLALWIDRALAFVSTLPAK